MPWLPIFRPRNLKKRSKSAPRRRRERRENHNLCIFALSASQRCSVSIRLRKHKLKSYRDKESVRKARVWAAEELRAAGVDSPMLTADLMLGLVLEWDRVRVLSHPETALSPAQLERFSDLVGRRIRGEPFQYMAGEREFYGHCFKVTPSVLIPRPETEILVEKALELAKGLPELALRFADVGTGSGCIAISLLLESPKFTGTAVDLSLDALRVARENAVFHNVTERLRLVCADLLECAPPRPFFDFILSNPPYCAEAESNTLPATVREYEP
ncbi:MAG: prmC, partial [Acidobacteria bacterium]|nr:prmC [Acidobacteriota bacterium]